MEAPQKLCDETLLELLLGQIGHVGFSGYLRRRSAASSLRSTLLGEAGWHRAISQKPELLTMCQFITADGIVQEPMGPPRAADQLT
jgi:hypothetical protein